ncbi:hypothetical protein RI138_09960 [Streptomyces sp. C11-1]|uniref:Transcriptional regulator n=1 Tax=Streptomyces durocortorensis TaxID=2811104 RepID=A0ABY9VTM7_9ACTN|nr:hypothetical protein [Streptomyces durocortorensis]WNF27138.1 hypothetical protein RI138_09960 [Streptomyces durocortorensis]
MRARRTPNQALRILLGEAGWSGARLAREVNALGAAQGNALHYDRTAVAHWLAGSRPRRPVPSLVAEALSRRLGRTVREQDTGLSAPRSPGRAPVAPAGEEGAVARLEHVLNAVDRRGVTLVGAYSLAALVTSAGPPVTPPAGPAPAGQAAPVRQAGIPRQVGTVHVMSAREMLALFSQGDAVFGAGRVHEPLRQYLSVTVLPWLKREMTPGVRRELLTVASRLTYLCAFTHFDMNHHAAAQRLYLTGAELAREAGDRIGHGLALRGLSVQAHALGHFGEAHHLAEQAVQESLRYAPPHQQAFFHGQLAVALAARGDVRHARHLAAADRCLERSSNGDSPVGAFHPGSLALQRASVAVSRGDRRTAAAALDISLRHRPADERRSRALGLAELAENRLAIGHLEQACHAWHRFLDVYPRIHSARADDRVRLMIAKSRPYTTSPAVAALHARAHELRRGRSAAPGE